MRQIRTTLDIDAPPAKVWRILADLAHWDDWNPMIQRVRGRAEPDAPIDFSLRLGKRAVPIQVRMLRVQPERELCWKGPRVRALAPLFAGEHYFTVEPLDGDRTRFVHGERFTGLLVPVVWRRLEPALLQGYAKVNEALKRKAEATS